ncbi:MAG: DNA polymerase [Candidatus Neomarinimicrobiota bacterium]
MIRTVLDFESAYGKHPVTGENITLSKITVENYVRHPLFKVHGLGVKIEQDPAFYVYGGDLLHFLKAHPWGQTFAICHHTHFDGAIFSWRAGIRPAFWGDTLSMARAIFPHESCSLSNIARLLGVGEKGIELANFAGKWSLTDQEQAVLGAYCRNDVELTSRVFDALKGHFPVSEMRLIDLTIRLFTEPVLQVDRGVLIEEYKRERRTKRALLKACAVDKTVLSSGDQFAQLLLTLGVDPPKKLSPSKVKDGRVNPDNAGEPPLGILPDWKRLGQDITLASKLQHWTNEQISERREQLKAAKDSYPWTYAFGKSDEEFAMLQEHPDEQVRAVVDARLGVKSTIKETRSKRFYKIGSRGAFPVYLTYYGAHTGRWSGGDKQNAQNLGRVDPRDPTSGALRRSLLAPAGHVLVVRDLGQIEARMLAYWAGQEDLVNLFREGGDPYNRQASKIFGYEVNRKKPEFFLEGLVGKASTLGNGYGMGWGKFQETLRVGFLGAPSLLFDQEAAQKLGADVDVFCHTRSYKKGCATLQEEALAMKPLNVSVEAHLWHCAAVKQIVDKYRESNSAIVAGWREAQQALTSVIHGEEIAVGQRGMVTTCGEGFVLPNGMKIRYHKLRATDSGELRYLANVRKKEWSYIYGGKAVENLIQALSRIVLSDQMLNINRRLKEWREPGKIYQTVTSTHDEVVCCVPEYRAHECLQMMETEMATAPPWCSDLPLKSSGGFAVSYGECDK